MPRNAEFDQMDANHYNSASIRVRVIDPRFEGVPTENRDAMVEPPGVASGAHASGHHEPVHLRALNPCISRFGIEFMEVFKTNPAVEQGRTDQGG